MIRDMTTEDDIVAALADLLVEEHPAAISVPAVAARAGVSTRTVYRYFPTKADLLDAAARRHNDKVADQVPADPGDDVEAYLAPLWRSFAEDVEAVRSEHTSPGGRELRAHRLPASRRQVRASLDRAVPDIDPARADLLVDLLVSVTGSGMFLELVDRCGRTPDEAAALAATAVRAVFRDIARTTREVHA